jgi:uncharacterized protein YbaR (Trm112 family)
MFDFRALLACQSCADSISPRHFSDVLCFTLPYPHQSRDVHLQLRRPTPRPFPTSPPSLCSDMHRLTQRCAPANGHSLIMLTCPSTHHRLHIVMATPTISDVPSFTVPYPHVLRAGYLHLRCPVPPPLFSTSPPSLCFDVRPCHPSSAPRHRHSLIMLTCPSAHHRLHIFMVTPTISDVPFLTVPYPHVLRAGYLHLRCPVPPPLFSTSPPSLCFDVRLCHPSSAPPHRHSLIMLTCPSTHHRLHIFMVTPTISDVPFFT